MEPEGSSRIDTEALKVRIHHRDEVDLKSNYKVYKNKVSEYVSEWVRESKQTNEQVPFYARLKWRNGNDQTVENEEGVNDYYSAKKRFL